MDAIGRLRASVRHDKTYGSHTYVAVDDLRALLTALDGDEVASLFALNLKSVAKRERNIGNQELSELIDEAALMIDRLAMRSAAINGVGG